MEAPEELSLGSKEHTNIVKGKRTKRVRPQSPIPFSITANSSTGEEGEKEDCYNGVDDNNNNSNKDDDANTNTNNINTCSPTTSYAGLSSQEEEEDMANCLILLAQGQAKESPKHTPPEEDVGMNYTKYSSRKFMEAAALDSGKAGFYVYECKTCNRHSLHFKHLVDTGLVTRSLRPWLLLQWPLEIKRKSNSFCHQMRKSFNSRPISHFLFN
uniref:Uncharacterized protein n=1 Tax=Lotus japonicus TaxID=34305 RepID=I3T9G3_LOTJA|nr:unknown [Lotus japonicus]